MSKQNDLGKSLVALEQDATLIAVVEMGQASWLVAGIVPGLDRYPLKKVGPDGVACQSRHRRDPNRAPAWRLARDALSVHSGREGGERAGRLKAIAAR